MAKYNLCTVRPNGFLHSSAFAEVKESLAWALTALGHAVLLTENCFAPSVNIIIGAELFDPQSTLPPNSVVYNMEQPSHPNMANVRRLATGHQVWDISVANVARWKADGFDVRHVPVGYTPNLTRIPKAPLQDIDVCFFGWLTERRRKLAENLKSAGLKIYFSDCCYGGARDQILSRSKVCLNVHHDGRDMFEIVRVSYLLANSKCVVTEQSSDIADYAEVLDGALEWWPYEQLVEACSRLAKYDATRYDYERTGFSRMIKQDYVATIARAINSPSSASPIRDRYAAGAREGDMRDFLPFLRSVAKGQLLEIGVRDGASTSAFLLGLEELGGNLTSIDIADCSGLWTHPQWRFIRQDSRQVIFDDNSFDLALIDGDHSPEGFLADLLNCVRWVKPGGMILCHDISPLPNYTKEAAGGDWPSQYVGKEFYTYAKEHSLRHWVMPGAWGLGVIINDKRS